MGARRHGHAVRRRVDGIQPGAVALVGEHQQDVGGRGIRKAGDRSAQHDAAVGLHRRRPRSRERPDRGDRGAVGDTRQQRGGVLPAPVRMTRASRRRRVDSHGPGMQRGAELLGDDAGLDHRHARAAVLLGDQQPRGAQRGQPAPDLVGGAGRIVEHRPHMGCDAGLFGQEAPHGVAQCHLLIGEFEVHLRGSPSTRVAVMPLLIWVVPPAMVRLRDDRRRSTHRPLCARAEHVERQRGELLAGLRPHALGQARRPERVAAVQRRRDRPLAQQFEVFDAHRDLTQPAQRRAVLEHRRAVDGVVGQVGDEVGQLHLHLRVQPRRSRALVAQRRGGDLPSRR